ncbi:MAG: hypothetical protein LWY06_15150 [Firmicutes bacterium]|nr:hypothetical protein [Bacillota bacterium]
MVSELIGCRNSKLLTILVCSLVLFVILSGCQANTQPAKQGSSTSQNQSDPNPDKTPEPEATNTLPEGVTVVEGKDNPFTKDTKISDLKEAAPAEQTEFYCQFYPGAKEVKTYEGTFTKFNDVKTNVKSVVFESGDKVGAIAEFYLTQLPNPVMTVDGDDVYIMSGADMVLGNGKIESVVIRPLKDKGASEIVLFSSDMEI